MFTIALEYRGRLASVRQPATPDTRYELYEAMKQSRDQLCAQRADAKRRLLDQVESRLI